MYRAMSVLVLIYSLLSLYSPPPQYVHIEVCSKLSESVPKNFVHVVDLRRHVSVGPALQVQRDGSVRKQRAWQGYLQ